MFFQIYAIAVAKIFFYVLWDPEKWEMLEFLD